MIGPNDNCTTREWSFWSLDPPSDGLNSNGTKWKKTKWGWTKWVWDKVRPWPSGNGLNAIGLSVIGLNVFRPSGVCVTFDIPEFESKSSAFE